MRNLFVSFYLVLFSLSGTAEQKIDIQTLAEAVVNRNAMRSEIGKTAGLVWSHTLRAGNVRPVHPRGKLPTVKSVVETANRAHGNKDFTGGLGRATWKGAKVGARGMSLVKGPYGLVAQGASLVMDAGEVLAEAGGAVSDFNLANNFVRGTKIQVGGIGKALNYDQVVAAVRSELEAARRDPKIEKELIEKGVLPVMKNGQSILHIRSKESLQKFDPISGLKLGQKENGSRIEKNAKAIGNLKGQVDRQGEQVARNAGKLAEHDAAIAGNGRAIAEQGEKIDELKKGQEELLMEVDLISRQNQIEFEQKKKELEDILGREILNADDYAEAVMKVTKIQKTTAQADYALEFVNVGARILGGGKEVQAVAAVLSAAIEIFKIAINPSDAAYLAFGPYGAALLVVMKLFEALGNIFGGPSIEEQILDQIEIVQEQIRNLQKSVKAEGIHTREADQIQFEQLEWMLDEVRDLLSHNHEEVVDRLRHIDQRVQTGMDMIRSVNRNMRQAFSERQWLELQRAINRCEKCINEDGEGLAPSLERIVEAALTESRGEVQGGFLAPLLGSPNISLGIHQPEMSYDNIKDWTDKLSRLLSSPDGTTQMIPNLFNPKPIPRQPEAEARWRSQFEKPTGMPIVDLVNKKLAQKIESRKLHAGPVYSAHGPINLDYWNVASGHYASKVAAIVSPFLKEGHVPTEDQRRHLLNYCTHDPSLYRLQSMLEIGYAQRAAFLRAFSDDSSGRANLAPLLKLIKNYDDQRVALEESWKASIEKSTPRRRSADEVFKTNSEGISFCDGPKDVFRDDHEEGKEPERLSLGVLDSPFSSEDFEEFFKRAGESELLSAVKGLDRGFIFACYEGMEVDDEDNAIVKLRFDFRTGSSRKPVLRTNVSINRAFENAKDQSLPQWRRQQIQNYRAKWDIYGFDDALKYLYPEERMVEMVRGKLEPSDSEKREASSLIQMAKNRDSALTEAQIRSLSSDVEQSSGEHFKKISALKGSKDAIIAFMNLTLGDSLRDKRGIELLTELTKSSIVPRTDENGKIVGAKVDREAQAVLGKLLAFYSEQNLSRVGHEMLDSHLENLGELYETIRTSVKCPDGSGAYEVATPVAVLAGYHDFEIDPMQADKRAAINRVLRLRAEAGDSPARLAEISKELESRVKKVFVLPGMDPRNELDKTVAQFTQLYLPHFDYLTGTPEEVSGLNLLSERQKKRIGFIEDLKGVAAVQATRWGLAPLLASFLTADSEPENEVPLPVMSMDPPAAAALLFGNKEIGEKRVAAAKRLLKEARKTFGTADGDLPKIAERYYRTDSQTVKEELIEGEKAQIEIALNALKDYKKEFQEHRAFVDSVDAVIQRPLSVTSREHGQFGDKEKNESKQVRSSVEQYEREMLELIDLYEAQLKSRHSKDRSMKADDRRLVELYNLWNTRRSFGAKSALNFRDLTVAKELLRNLRWAADDNGRKTQTLKWLHDTHLAGIARQNAEDHRHISIGRQEIGGNPSR